MRLHPIRAFVLLAAFSASAAPPTSRPNSAPAKQPVLVELFTSEGCSDCPPADTLLKKLSEAQPLDGIEIIALEEHVDYWNRQGWMDPFSSSDFTRRQNEYADYIPKSSVYTPQMVVDGHAQLIGSRGKEAIDQIRAAAAQPKARLLLSLAPGPKPRTKNLELRFDDTSAQLSASSLDVYVAITEKDLQSKPNAGENSGAALVHAPVVRQLRKFHSIRPPLIEPLSLTLEFRDNWAPANLAVVAFLVDPHTHQVRAAGETPVGATF
jgi:hypothetical protein